MEKKKLKCREIGNPFLDRQDAYVSDVVFDTTYKSIKIIDKVKKTGEGDEDFVIEKVVITEET